VLDYRLLRPAVRIRLELDSLPKPPLHKRLLCTAAKLVGSTQAGTRADTDCRGGPGPAAIAQNAMPSCAQIAAVAPLPAAGVFDFFDTCRAPERSDVAGELGPSMSRRSGSAFADELPANMRRRLTSRRECPTEPWIKTTKAAH
jgi:hypothetical protein